MTAEELRSPETETGVKPVNRTAIIAATTAVCFVVGCLTLLAWADKPTEALMTIVTAIVVPLLGMLGYSKLASMQKDTDSKLSAMHQTTEQVKTQTNGNQSEMLSMMREFMQNQQAMLDKRLPTAEKPPEQ